ncbi:tautomerase family protein [Bibersteinia trehalosi]|uniref:4-oxalocrotonate tautomerase n=1 Tax=Bibersteinia trehalosi TaxID=47735 RepID=UPI002D764D2A|nr:4-oxalocrotonate tautomerase [Bibersteinia trehalosi]
MPHISLKCYPKGLSESQLQQFADELTAFVGERLNTPTDYITIDYQELEEAEFKTEVWDKAIAPQADTLLRKPHYQL